MLKDLFDYIQQEWNTLRQAPWIFVLILILSTGVAIGLVTWRYQGVVDFKSATIETLKTQLTASKSKIDETINRLVSYEKGTRIIPTEKGYYLEFSNLRLMAQELAPYVPTDKYIAVVPFTMDNVQTPVGRLLAEELIVELIQASPASFIDRSYLPQLMTEMNFSSSALVDISDKIIPGKIKPADILIVGQYIDMGYCLRLSVRIIEVKSGFSLSANSKSLLRVKEAVK